MLAPDVGQRYGGKRGNHEEEPQRKRVMRKEFWRHSSRGRRPGRATSSFIDPKALESLAIIALKYKIDSSELFDCIMQAWSKEKAECGQLSIICRQKTEDSAIFLFTTNQGVIAQFSIPVATLQGKNPLESYIRMISPITVKKVAIKDLKAGMKRINLIAKVLEIPEPNKVYTKYGIEAYISNALIGDETGTIRMSLWNKQIDMMSEGDTIKIENGMVARFRGELQLRIGRSGSPIRATQEP